MPPMPPNASPQSEWETCPNCRKKFDPRANELLECPQCGEQKCTAECMPDPTVPCLDCQALKPDPDDGGFEPGKEAAPAGVFDAGFSAQANRSVEEEDE